MTIHTGFLSIHPSSPRRTNKL